MVSTHTSYDFIVVGSGPAGATLASTLAKASKKPSVLLLEAGGANDNPKYLVDGKRLTTLMEPGLNWGFKTVPQVNCNNRELDFSRGLGLGGSTAINFGVFTVGPRDDYDEWARLVGDESFAWGHMQGRLRKLESFHGVVPGAGNTQDYTKYASSRIEHHGSDGPLCVGYPEKIEGDMAGLLDTFEQTGFPLNPDHNSGNPIGMGITISTAYKGRRSTAKDLVIPSPDNLTVVTEHYVWRLVFDADERKVTGIETTNGSRFFANKEVVLSAGTLNTPHILMHSGIGPADQLQKFNIPVKHDIPTVGKGLRDHPFVPMAFKRKPGLNPRQAFYSSPEAQETALRQWEKDGTGDWATLGCTWVIGFLKMDALLSSPEFASVPEDVKRHQSAPTVPHVELLANLPAHFLLPHLFDGKPDNLDYTSLLVWPYNTQSRGTVTLQSADPNIPLAFDPNFLSQDFDRRAAVLAMSEAMRFVRSEQFAKNTVGDLQAPASDDPEDLLEFFRANLGASWHMTGTLRMGKREDVEAPVDSEFRLKGVEGVRVADMSVVPLLMNCHTQAVAYLTGATCADKLIAEYCLA